MVQVADRPHKVADTEVNKLMLLGNVRKLGAILSTTVTVNEPVAILPDRSVTV